VDTRAGALGVLGELRFALRMKATGALADAYMVTAAALEGGAPAAPAPEAAAPAPTAAQPPAPEPPAAVAGAAGAPSSGLPPVPAALAAVGARVPAPFCAADGPRFTPAAAAGGDCACAYGWGGDACNACTSDAACRGLMPDDPRATCDGGLAYGPYSQYKSYACVLTDELLGSFVTSISLACSADGQNLPVGNLSVPLPPDPSGGGGSAGAGAALAGLGGVGGGAALAAQPYCVISGRLAGAAPGVQLSCSALSCALADGSPNLRCEKVACACTSAGGAAAACPDQIRPIVEGLGAWATLACASDDGGAVSCSVDVEGLPTALQADCAVGQCVSKLRTSTALLSAGSGAEPPPPYIPLVSALPVASLLLLAIPGLLAYAANRRIFAAIRGTSAGGKGGGGEGSDGLSPAVKAAAAAVGAPSQLERPVGGSAPALVLGFEGLSVTVPAATHRHGGGGWAARAAAACAAPLRRRRGRHAGEAAAIDEEAAASAGRRAILLGVSGAGRSGEMMGILGPSGSGKTTLLSLLSGNDADMGAGARASGRVHLGADGGTSSAWASPALLRKARAHAAGLRTPPLCARCRLAPLESAPLCHHPTQSNSHLPPPPI
jgi:hypothetical protein